MPTDRLRRRMFTRITFYKAPISLTVEERIQNIIETDPPTIIDLLLDVGCSLTCLWYSTNPLKHFRSKGYYQTAIMYKNIGNDSYDYRTISSDDVRILTVTEFKFIWKARNGQALIPSYETSKGLLSPDTSGNIDQGAIDNKIRELARDAYNWCSENTDLEPVDVYVRSHPCRCQSYKCCKKRLTCWVYRRFGLMLLFVISMILHLLILILFLPIVIVKNFGKTITSLVGLATSILGALNIGSSEVRIASGVLSIISGILVIVLQFKINEDALFRPHLTTYKIYDKIVGTVLPDIPQYVVGRGERSREVLKNFQTTASLTKYISDCICLIRVWLTVGEAFTDAKTSAILFDLIPKLVTLSNELEVFSNTPSTALGNINKYKPLLYALREPEATRKLFVECQKPGKFADEDALLKYCDAFNSGPFGA